MGYYPENSYQLRAFEMNLPENISDKIIKEDELKTNRTIEKEILIRNRVIYNNLFEMMKLNIPVTNQKIKNKKYTENSRRMIDKKLKEVRDSKFKIKMVS